MLSPEHYDWVYKFTGIHPGAPPNSEDDAPPLSAVPNGSGSEQAQQFAAQYKPIIAAIDGHLSFTAANAQADAHRQHVAKRESVVQACATALKAIDPADEDKAKSQLEQTIGTARGVQGEIAAFRQATEKALNAWRSREPHYEEMAHRLEEMDTWGHPKAPDLNQPVAEVADYADERKYTEASAAFDALPAQFAPVWDDYTKQKAAQAKYEPARNAINSRLQATQNSEFKKLEDQRSAFAPAVASMDSAVQAKNYVDALKTETETETKLKAYEAALADLRAKQDAYKAALAQAQPKLDQADKQADYKTLRQMKADLETGHAQMVQSAQDEDFDPARVTAQGLSTKADTYNNAVATLERQKQEFETEKNAMTAKINQVNQARKYQKLDVQFNEVMTSPPKVDQLAEAEDFVGATKAAKEIEAKADAYIKADAVVKQEEQEFDKRNAKLQPKLDQAKEATKFKKLDAQFQELTSGQTRIDEAVKAEDFNAAAVAVGDVEPKADAYLKAVKDLTAQKAAFDAAWDAVQTRLTEASKPSFKTLAQAQTEIADLSTKIDSAAKDEDFAGASEQIKALTTKLDAFEAQYKHLDEQKKLFDTEKTALLKKMDEVGKTTPHKKLASQLQALTDGQAPMNQAADAEEFENATAQAKDLQAKADEYLKAVVKLEEEKAKFDAVAGKVRDRAGAASQVTYKTLEQAKTEIADQLATMEGLANDEEYTGALEQADQLDPKLTDFESRLDKIKEQEKKYLDEKPTLQDKLDQAAHAPTFKKFDAMLQELNAGQGQVDQLAQAEDFAGAYDAAKDLETKADAYIKAATDADEEKKAFDKAVDDKITPRIQGVETSNFKTLEPLQTEIKDRKAKMDETAGQEDFKGALDQANQISDKLDEYDQKLADLTAKKQKCDEVRKDLQTQIDEIKQVSHPKLASLVSDIDTALKQMDDAISNEDFGTALTLGDDIKAKIENYHTAEKDLEAKRVAFVPAFSDVLTRMDKAKPLCEQFHEKIPDSFETLRSAIESDSKNEEYEEATKKIDQIKADLDPLEKRLQELVDLKNKCDDARKALQPQIDEIKLATHPKLAPQMQEIDATMKAFDDSMVIQDYKAALASSDKLGPLIAKYKDLEKDIDAKRAAYNKPSTDVLTRLADIRGKCAKTGETMPEPLETLGHDIVNLEAAEEFEQGMKKIDELNKALDDFEKKLSLTDDFSRSDEETQKVRANIVTTSNTAGVRLAAIAQAVTNAVLAFERQAKSEIPSIVGDDSDTATLTAQLISAVGIFVSALFPPAGPFVAGANFIANARVNVITKEEGQAKQALENWIGQFATSVTKAMDAGVDRDAKAVPDRLTSMARTDKSIWDLLAGPYGSQEVEQLLTRLQIPNNPREIEAQLVKNLMSTWGAWSAKEKALRGKTKQERMLADSDPNDPAGKDARQKAAAGGAAGAARADGM